MNRLCNVSCTSFVGTLSTGSATYGTTPTHDFPTFRVVLVPALALAAPDSSFVPIIDVVLQLRGYILFDIDCTDAVGLDLFRCFDNIFKLRLETWKDLD